MFTAKIYVDTKRHNALMLRITNNRKKAELSLGFQLSEETLADSLSLNPRQENVRYKALFARWNIKIEDLRLELAKEERANEDVKVIRDMISRALFGEKTTESEQVPVITKGTFLPFFIRHTEAYERRSTRESNEYTRSVMEKFTKVKGVSLDTLNFEDINYGWLSDLDRFMESSGLSQNTRRIHFANIRAAINDAHRRELTDSDPFRRFRLKTEKTAKRSLSVDELRQLFEYEVEPHATYYRDMFKLIFMLIGINTVDLYRLKEISRDGRIDYRRAKTGRLYSIKVEPEAMDIINRYRGDSALLNIADKYKDHRYFRRDTNDALRLIGEVKRTGRGGKKVYKPLFPEIGTYHARHTWATIAYSIGISKDVISQALGHSTGLAVTEIYIDRDFRLVDEANRKVLDWVLYGKK